MESILDHMVLKQKNNELLLDDEDMVFAETVAKLIAGSLHRIDLDRGLKPRCSTLKYSAS